MIIIDCLMKKYPDWKGAVYGNSIDGIRPDPLETRPIPSIGEFETLWAAVLADQQAEQARIAAKVQAIADNLPSRAQVKAAIDAAFPDAKQNNIITKLADIVYWLAKDTID